MTFSLLGLSARFKEKSITSKESAFPATAGNNASPGSRPLSNHVPRRYTKPFPNNPHSDKHNVFAQNNNQQLTSCTKHG